MAKTRLSEDKMRTLLLAMPAALAGFGAGMMITSLEEAKLEPIGALGILLMTVGMVVMATLMEMVYPVPLESEDGKDLRVPDEQDQPSHRGAKS